MTHMDTTYIKQTAIQQITQMQKTFGAQTIEAVKA